MVKLLAKVTSLLIVVFTLAITGLADVRETLNPFDTSTPEDGDSADKDRSAEELVLEGRNLLLDDRLIDARTKLLAALSKDPKNIEAHILLASYYMQHVGHFRLALKYVKQAQALSIEKMGPPPYEDFESKSQHAQLLYLLSQARLNLDNYQGALDVLDEYNAYGYYAEWYASSRSWILMKLGRMDEAIKIARMGVLTGFDPGRTLNMLGILLSMTHQRQAALDIFKKAVEYESSLGSSGQPATPLNNQGEVYKEIFNENMAELSWLRSTSMSDGCEHVLPSLNLALLYIEQVNYNSAKRTIDAFESCVAQFPLRNGEEHRALVHLARGRIALHTGHIFEAVEHFESALAGRQWFGKIGTSQADLEVGALISLATALRADSFRERYRIKVGFLDRLNSLHTRITNRTRSWWLMRRARQILAEDLSDIEDLYLRNTDSMIEYPTFGSLLAGYPPRTLAKRIAAEDKEDDRERARPYYDAYRGESAMRFGSQAEAFGLLEQAFRTARKQYDELLRVHLLLLQAKLLGESTDAGRAVTYQAFEISRAELRNYGVLLPVNFSGLDAQLESQLNGSGFILNNTLKLPYLIVAKRDGAHLSLALTTGEGSGSGVNVSGEDSVATVNKFIDTVFSEDIE